MLLAVIHKACRAERLILAPTLSFSPSLCLSLPFFLSLSLPPLNTIHGPLMQPGQTLQVSTRKETFQTPSPWPPIN